MRLYVVPSAGARIRYIDSSGNVALLPDEGASVEDSSFWQRRLRDEEVVVGAPPIAKPARKRGEE
jgi:hypothetical protein